MADGLTNSDVPIDGGIETLVDRADLDGLVRAVDGLCTSRSWSEVLRTRDLCRWATRSGRQVWPIAALCEYRLALHASAEWACRVLDDESSRFSIGPLTEVIAQSHTWEELRDLLPPGPHREIVAHERLIRGETIDFDIGTAVLDIPTTLSDWEPEYSVATYSDSGIDAPSPSDGWSHEWVEIAAQADEFIGIDDEETESALRELVSPWTAASSGRARATIVEGGIEALAAALNRSQVRVAALTAAEALGWIAWCGSSSGSHGRRRGAAAGRFNAWWMLAALAGVDSSWDELRAAGRLSQDLGEAARRFSWYRIDLGERHSYELSLAAVDDEEGIAFGLFAYDDPH